MALSTPTPARIASIVTSKVAALTGPQALVSQQAVDICGTDLGTMTELDGKIYFAFGDTFGYDANGVCARNNNAMNWRSNVLAWTDVADPKNGLALSNWLTGTDGRAIAVIEGAHQTPVTGQPTEQTKIPTAMVTVGSVIHLHYMSIHDFAANGAWNCNYSAWVTSLDGGLTWTPDSGQFTGPSSNFLELALVAGVTPDNADGQFVYALGTPGGRFGAARLGRVPASSVTDPTLWQYCSGADAKGVPAWVTTESAAVDIVPGPVGEASILWNPALRCWMYTYLNETAAALQLRQAQHLWGPWSDPITIATAKDFPQLYGAFMTPSLLSSDGLTLYFVMSQFGPYDTFLMKALLTLTK